jgi:hypothetical protein
MAPENELEKNIEKLAPVKYDATVNAGGHVENVRLRSVGTKNPA